LDKDEPMVFSKEVIAWKQTLGKQRKKEGNTIFDI